MGSVAVHEGSSPPARPWSRCPRDVPEARDGAGDQPVGGAEVPGGSSAAVICAWVSIAITAPSTAAAVARSPPHAGQSVNALTSDWLPDVALPASAAASDSASSPRVCPRLAPHPRDVDVQTVERGDGPCNPGRRRSQTLRNGGARDLPRAGGLGYLSDLRLHEQDDVAGDLRDRPHSQSDTCPGATGTNRAGGSASATVSGHRRSRRSGPQPLREAVGTRRRRTNAK